MEFIINAITDELRTCLEQWHKYQKGSEEEKKIQERIKRLRQLRKLAEVLIQRTS